MPNLLSVRFSKIGFTETRLDGLNYSVSHNGEVKNSLVITSNGGGKTSQIHLILSLFLPQHRELMTSKDSSGRTFEYYFEEKEIAIIATEWTIPNSQRSLDGRQKTRVIGRFTQYTNRDRHEHETYFFSFIADDQLGIDDLPITSSIPHRVPAYCKTMSEVKKYLKSTFDKPGREFSGSISHLDNWQRHLRELGFNIDIFRIMQLITLSEGSADNFIKKYSNHEAVLGLVTKEVMDGDSTSKLREMLVQHRVSLSSAPVTRLQIQAYNSLSELLSRMQPVAEALIGAESNYDRVMTDLVAVGGRIKATLAVEEEKYETLKTEQLEDKGRLAGERKSLTELQSDLRGVNERLASLACQVATVELEAATEQLNHKTDLLHAIRSLIDHVDVLSAKTERDDLARQLDRLAEPSRNLADELAMAEYLLVDYLGQNKITAAAEIDRLEKAGREASASKREIAANKQEQSSRLAVLQSEDGRLKKTEEERLLSINSFMAEECIAKCSGGEGIEPQKILHALQTESSHLTERGEELRSEMAAIKGDISLVGSELKNKKAGFVALRQERDKAAVAYEKYQRNYDMVARMPGIKSVFVLETPDLFRPGLVSKLKGQVSACETDIRKQESEIASRKERILEIEKNGGLLPSSHDVETVLETLRAANLDAHSYWQIFSHQSRSAEEAEAELRKDPFRVGGVAVLGATAVESAKEILAACNVLSPVSVTDYSAVIESQIGKGFTVFPNASLAIDRESAKKFCETAEKEIAGIETKIARLATARDFASDAWTQLLSFLGGNSETTEETLQTEIRRIEKDLFETEAEIARLTAKEEDATKRLAAVQEIFEDVVTRARTIEPFILTVHNHIVRFENERRERLDRIRELAGVIDGLQGAIELLEEEYRVAEGIESAAQAALSAGRTEMVNINKDLNNLGGKRIPPTAAFMAQATNTESARALYLVKARALESANANEEYIRVNTQYEGAKKLYDQRQTAWDAKYDGTVSSEILLAAKGHVDGDVAKEEDYQKVANLRDAALRAQASASVIRKTLAEEELLIKKAHINMTVSPCALGLEEAKGRQKDLISAVGGLEEAIAVRKEAIADRVTDLEKTESQVEMLNLLLSDLPVPERGEYLPYADSQEARNTVSTIKRDVKAISQEVEGQKKVLIGLNIDLSELLDSSLCKAISKMGELVKEEQRRSVDGLLKDNIEDYIGRIANGIESLKFDLNQHEQNERKVVDQLALDVKKALGYLKRLETRSKVPPLGGVWEPWTGKPFIRFWTGVDEDSDQSRQAITDTVTLISQTEGDIPPGHKIVYAALSNVLGKAFKIETLKPDTFPTTAYKDIEHPIGLGSWSGGERLSGAVLFYLAICSLLSVEGHAGNVLLLDNPFGSCNNNDFIRLIIALARQYGVQIVAYTPTQEEGIRRLFPINVMIRKGGVDGIIKSTGRPVVKYDKTIYNVGEITNLEITKEPPLA